MPQPIDTQTESMPDPSGPVAEVMELVSLMLAECPYPIEPDDRREAIERRLPHTTQALPRGDDRRAAH